MVRDITVIRTGSGTPTNLGPGTTRFVQGRITAFSTGGLAGHDSAYRLGAHPGPRGAPVPITRPAAGGLLARARSAASPGPAESVPDELHRHLPWPAAYETTVLPGPGAGPAGYLAHQWAPRGQRQEACTLAGRGDRRDDFPSTTRVECSDLSFAAPLGARWDADNPGRSPRTRPFEAWGTTWFTLPVGSGRARARPGPMKDRPTPGLPGIPDAAGPLRPATPVFGRGGPAAPCPTARDGRGHPAANHGPVGWPASPNDWRERFPQPVPGYRGLAASSAPVSRDCPGPAPTGSP